KANAVPQRTLGIRRGRGVILIGAPANAGVHLSEARAAEGWVPAFAGTRYFFGDLRVLRVLCGIAFFYWPGSQAARRREASAMSSVEPAKERRIQLSPWIGSKSRPGVTATPV